MADIVRRGDYSMAPRTGWERGKTENVHTYERQYGQFTRTFTLPDNIDLDHITSELREGVLTIVIPLAANARARKIQITGAPRSRDGHGGWSLAEYHSRAK